MSSVTLRRLVPGDEARLFEFLEPYVDSSLFLFSNVERAGLEDRGETFQGTYVAAFDASGTMTSVAAHCWNGNVMVQGDVGLEQAAVHAAGLSARAVRGFVGPPALTARARTALGLDATPAAHDSREVLFSLSLDELKVPAPLAGGELRLRVPSRTEATGLLLEWRIAYAVESLGAARNAALENEARELMESWGLSGKCWVLMRGSEIVAMTGFNAEARGIVQVGGVYTPPALRGRGYARAAVAGSLEVARSKGATRSVLFTPETNVAAQRAYLALGYRVVGDFGLVLF
jgi:RimJ/RimL family protein N-acetyltransferase